MSQHMEPAQHMEEMPSNTKRESRSISQPEPKLPRKTKFNEAEYKRWSDKLQASRSGKKK